MARFTLTTLRGGIEEINGWLASAGAKVRFEVGGRNGYQAVDEYTVDTDGNRLGSGVNRMVGSGTFKQTYDEAYEAYNGILRKIERNKQKALKDLVNREGITVDEIRASINDLNDDDECVDCVTHTEPGDCILCGNCLDGNNYCTWCQN